MAAGGGGGGGGEGNQLRQPQVIRADGLLHDSPSGPGAFKSCVLRARFITVIVAERR